MSERHPDIEFRIPNTGFSLKTMKKHHIPEAIKIYVESFLTPTAPMYSFPEVDPKEIEEVDGKFLGEKCEEGFSFVVEDESGKIVACFIAFDISGFMSGEFSLDDLKKERKKSPYSQAYDFSCQISEKMYEITVRTCQERDIKKCLHLSSSAVTKSARGNGLLRRVWKLMTKIAAEQNYELMVSETSNIFSHHVSCKVVKNSIEIWGSIDYDTFECVGKEDKKVHRPYKGCNEKALKWLKDNGLYKEAYGDEICKKLTLIVVDPRKAYKLDFGGKD